MEDDNNVVKAVESTPIDNTTNTDLSIENNALKELLADNRKTMDALRNELTQVKTTNAKLLNQLSVEEKKPDVEALLNTNFNKYMKGR